MWLIGLGLIVSGVVGFVAVLLHDGFLAPQPAWWSAYAGYTAMGAVIVGLLVCIWAFIDALNKIGPRF